MKKNQTVEHLGQGGCVTLDGDLSMSSKIIDVESLLSDNASVFSEDCSQRSNPF